ncbi:MAG TPA: TerB family tellurite resistance protein [Alphaproteobacteria bacterium]|nr:TerB family tellurite resistance protein [Alphaproteobacteria bacterium]
MFESLSRLFAAPAGTGALAMEPRLAVAALLVHLAAVDGAVKPEERDAVKGALMDYYELGEEEVDRLIAEAMRHDAESVDFYRFTSALATRPDAEKIEIVRMMWQVVFADRKNHELEDNVVWRVAELINVSARDRTILRNQMARG